MSNTAQVVSTIKEIKYEGRTVYVCDFCGLGYDDILLAYSCNEYCRTHGTPWDEITKKATYNPRIIARHPEAEKDIAQLRREIEQLKEEVAVTLAKAETEVAKAEAQDRITKLDAKLAQSVPRHLAERLTIEIKELEKKLALSVPRSEADALADKTRHLEAALTETLERLNLTEARSRNLDSRLRESESETYASSRIKELETTRGRVSIVSSCPNCRQPTSPDDIYCGNCGFTLLGQASSTPTPPLAVGSAHPPSGYKKKTGLSFRELLETPYELTTSPAAILVMPDQTEITLQQIRRVFGKSDLIKYLRTENANQVSNAHFTITQENGAFYIQDGGPDPQNVTITQENGIFYVQDGSNPQTWRPSVNGTRVNGTLLRPGAKQKLNPNDRIDVSQLSLNLMFKTNTRN